MAETVTPDVAPPSDAPGGGTVQFLRTGAIRVPVGREVVMTRRPGFGEFRRFREAYYALADEMGELAESSTLAAAHKSERIGYLLTLLNGTGDAPEPPEGTSRPADDDEARAELAALKNELNRLSRDVIERSEALCFAWVQETLNTLAIGKVRVPEDGDACDAYLFTRAFTDKVMEHLRTVPLDSGAS